MNERKIAMVSYKVVTYEMKSGLFGGTNFQKTDLEMANYLTGEAKQGWELVTMANVDCNSKNFTYKLVFKKED